MYHVRGLLDPCSPPSMARATSLTLLVQNIKDVPGSELEGWAHPCGLDAELLRQRTLSFSQDEFGFTAAAESILGSSDLSNLHRAPVLPPQQTPPALRRGQIQAQLGSTVSKAERKDARNHAVRFERTEEWRQFMDVYKRFIHEWVVPHVGNVPVLYQRKPILRVVLPGSVAPTQPHCDADYYHDSNELNFWMPLSRVWGSNTLWSESSPGAADYAPFECGPGEVVRFYGNRCRHYTTRNDEAGTRVSIDFRVIPHHLFQPPTELACTLSRHALNPGSSKRGYYALAQPAIGGLDAAELGALRQSWKQEVAERDSDSDDPNELV